MDRARAPGADSGDGGPGAIWAVVVAAGSGTRYGGRKQFALLGGRSVLDHAVAAVADHVDGVVVVVPPELAGAPPGDGRPGPGPDVRLVAGGETRSGSVRAGLAAVPPSCEIVIVHDAARPLASSGLCAAVVSAVRAGAGGAVPGLAVADTVKRVHGADVVETLDRDELVRVQTPQAFAAGLLRRAHAGEPEATDDATLVEAMGGLVVVVPGEESNVKLTSPDDLDLLAWWHHRMTSPVPTGDGAG